MLGNEYDKALADLEKVVHLQQQRKGGFGGNASEQEDEGILPGTDSPNAARDGVRSQVNMGVLSLQQKMYARALQQFTAALEGGGGDDGGDDTDMEGALTSPSKALSSPSKKSSSSSSLSSGRSLVTYVYALYNRGLANAATSDFRAAVADFERVDELVTRGLETREFSGGARHATDFKLSEVDAARLRNAALVNKGVICFRHGRCREALGLFARVSGSVRHATLAAGGRVDHRGKLQSVPVYTSITFLYGNE